MNGCYNLISWLESHLGIELYETFYLCIKLSQICVSMIEIQNCEHIFPHTNNPKMKMLIY